MATKYPKGCKGHSHPTLRKPIPRARAERELRSTYGSAGLPGRIVVVWSAELGETHKRNQRRYAQVLLGSEPVQFELAPQVAYLPAANRKALFAHEVGHVLAGPSGSEDDADQAAFEGTGVDIGYDHRWPGKGLQVSRNPAGKLRESSAQRVVESWLLQGGWRHDPRASTAVWVSGDGRRKLSASHGYLVFERGGPGRWERDYGMHVYGDALNTFDFAEQLLSDRSSNVANNPGPDERLRRAQRAGGIGGEVAKLKARIRSGGVSRERVALAAELGNPAATALMPEVEQYHVGEDGSFSDIGIALKAAAKTVGLDALPVLVGADFVEHSFRVFSDPVHYGASAQAVAAVRAWARGPSVEAERSCDDAGDFAREAYDSLDSDAAAEVAYAASILCGAVGPLAWQIDHVELAIGTLLLAIGPHPSGLTGFRPKHGYKLGHNEEDRWQRLRLADYVLGNVVAGHGSASNPPRGYDWKTPPACEPCGLAKKLKNAIPLKKLLGKKVRVHVNLHNGCYVVTHKGKVAGYSKTLKLTSVLPKVSIAGWKACSTTKVRNVHAYIEGTLASTSTRRPSGKAWKKITYRCKTHGPAFYYSSTERTFEGAAEVVFLNNGGKGLAQVCVMAKGRALAKANPGCGCHYPGGGCGCGRVKWQRA